MTDLAAWGWDRELQAALEEIEPADDWFVARVISEHRGGFRLMSAAGELLGMAPGRMRYRASGRRELPAVGDWVLARSEGDGPAAIQAILPRRTQFVRRMAGTEDREQVVAANIDLAFIVTSLNRELSLRRLERYLVAAWDSGARPVVLLSKTDLVDDPEPLLEAVREVAADVEVVPVSAVSGVGVERVRELLRPGVTVVLLGSSGVGKSTLVNLLAGEQLLRTQEVRAADQRGRHTTTQRQLFLLPSGALVLDTPGMREIGVVEADEGVEEAFEDVAELARACRFRDCKHESEPGCAVRQAVEAGQLEESRWIAYRKLFKEAAYQRRRADDGAARAEKERWKRIHKALRKTPKKD